MRKKIGLTQKIIIGFVLGIALGVVLNMILGDKAGVFTSTWIQPFGTLFMNLIKMIIVPLVFTSLIVGAFSLDDVKSMGRIGIKTVGYFLCTTAFAATIGLLIGNIFHVGANTGLSVTGLEYTVTESTGFIDTLLNIIPSNAIGALAEGNMLQIIVFALFIGGGIVTVGDKASTVKQFFEQLSNVMFNIMGGIMKIAPYAVFALMCNVTATYGSHILGKLITLIIAVYLACIIHALFVYSASVKLIARVSPIKFLKNMIPTAAFAFTSASSAAALPFTMEGAKKCGVPLSIRSFVLPLGTTINMDGTAVFQGICALFIANAYGMPLDIGQQAQVVLSSTLSSIGTAGVPGAGTIMLGMVLTQVGLPIDGIALIMGVDRILDMIRTATNVIGDSACSVVIARTENNLLSEEEIETE